MEGCSIGSCDLDEIPGPWLQYPENGGRTDGGWILEDSRAPCNETSGHFNLANVEEDRSGPPSYVTFFKEKNAKEGKKSLDFRYINISHVIILDS